MPKSWRTCEITQDCKYGFTKDDVWRFVSDWVAVKDYAYILHDRDKKDDFTPREPHIHLMIRFSCSVPTAAIIARAKRVGLPPECITENRIEKMKSWSAALNYLTHRDENKPYKHIYDNSCVVSNFDWELAAENAHQKKQLVPSQARAKQIVEMIDSGEIKEYNMADYITAWEEVLYQRQITAAFTRRKRQDKLKGDRNMEVVFISGPSGVGKDTFAVDMCEKEGFPYYRTSNNDNYPFDDYKGQPAIIWSDARDNIYKPQQLFALLDNHWKSSQKARYSDINLDCKILYITSIKPLREWYYEFFKNENEDRKQLYRRIGAKFEMDAEWVNMYVYNQLLNQYDRVGKLPNKYAHEDAYTIEKNAQKAYLKELLGGLADTATFFADNIDNPAYQPVSNKEPQPMTEEEKDATLEQFYLDKGYITDADGKAHKITAK